jgi:probable HAF family extracellular repeat protein
MYTTTHPVPRRAASAGPAFGLALALALACSSASAGPVPVDLGGLPGGSYSSARVINAKGRIMGLATDPQTFAFEQVMWVQGAISVRSACCAAGLGVPRALNRSLEAAGYADEGYEDGHWYWNAAGTPIRLPGLPGGIDRGSAFDINDAGLIVGYSVDTSLRRHAVVWNRTTFALDLGNELGATNSEATGINNLGDIVGDADGVVFVRRGAAVTTLGAGTALDINDAGLVAGYAPGMVPVLWRNGVREYLPGLYGGIAYGHTITSLNNVGDLVGFTFQRLGPLYNTAVLWRRGKAIDLGRYPGGTVSAAYGINDKGQIVGEGNVEPGGPMHALRWTVKPGLAPTVELVPE